MKPKVIAIDGTAASGKGTLARKMAENLDFAYLDTGRLYRYVGYAVLQEGGDPGEEQTAVAKAEELKKNIGSVNLDNPELGSDEVGQAASKAAAFPGVRAELLDSQREFAATPPEGKKGAVLDGRDIGTVVCPKADLKIYIDANIEIRAERRFKELHSKGIPVKYEAVLADMRARDARDTGRSTAPTRPADDAIVIDTSAMGADDVFEIAMSLARKKLRL